MLSIVGTSVGLIGIVVFLIGIAIGFVQLSDND
jgi:uncharacterized membrane protein YiaA